MARNEQLTPVYPFTAFIGIKANQPRKRIVPFPGSHQIAGSTDFLSFFCEYRLTERTPLIAGLPSLGDSSFIVSCSNL